MKKLILILILSLILTPTTLISVQGETFTKYIGKSAKDIGFAKMIYEAGASFGIKAVEVEESIMIVHVTEEVYRDLFYDRISGNRLMRNWQRLIAQNYGSDNIGTVWLYAGGQKVAECTTKGFLGTKVVVEWFDD